jgi:hypothetical protein
MFYNVHFVALCVACKARTLSICIQRSTQWCFNVLRVFSSHLDWKNVKMLAKIVYILMVHCNCILFNMNRQHSHQNFVIFLPSFDLCNKILTWVLSIEAVVCNFVSTPIVLVTGLCTVCFKLIKFALL